MAVLHVKMFELIKGRKLIKIDRFSSESEAEAGQIHQRPHGRHIADRVRLEYVKTREVREPDEWRRRAAFGLERIVAWAAGGLR